MTIDELRMRVLELESETGSRARAASTEFYRDLNHTDKWTRQKLSDKLVFWTDARNGLRMAADALLGLSMIEEDGNV